MPGRIVLQDAQAQGLRLLHHEPAHVADTHDADRFAQERKAVALTQAQQGGGYVLRDAVGITAGRRAPGDASLIEVSQIQVVGPDCRRTDKPYATAFQQGAVHPQGGTNHENVCIPNAVGGDLLRRQDRQVAPAAGKLLSA